MKSDSHALEVVIKNTLLLRCLLFTKNKHASGHLQLLMHFILIKHNDQNGFLET